MYSRQLKVFEELNESLPKDITLKWSQEPVEAILNDDGKWKSPMHIEEVRGTIASLRVSR